MVAPLLISSVLANVVDAANVAAALTVKESAASSPSVALPDAVKLAIDKVPVNTGLVRVLFSSV